MSVKLNEKTGKYYASFYYTDWQGNRNRKKKEGFKLARDAKAYEQDFLNKMASDCTITFENLFAYYIEDFSKRRKPTTVYWRQSMAQKHFIPIFGKMPINTITPATIRQWQNTIIEKGYKPAYQHSLNVSLSAIFSYAVQFYNLKENPVKIAGAIGKTTSNKISFWTLDEFNQFITTLASQKTNYYNPQKYILPYTLLFYTGMRLGEFLALTIEDIDLNNQTIRINKSYARLHKQDIIQAPKTTKSNRVITIPQKLCDMIQEYINNLYKPAPTDRLFANLTKYSLGDTIKSVASRANIKPISIHDLRHSHASMLINMNFNPLVISERLGHENVQTTLDVYSHLYPNKTNEVSNKLNDLL